MYTQVKQDGCVFTFLTISNLHLFLNITRDVSKSIVIEEMSFSCDYVHFAALKLLLKTHRGASLVAQWLRICLPMQETRVRALVWEDPYMPRSS